MLSPAEVEAIIHRLVEEANLKISASDVHDYYDAFAEFDRDKSGNISTSELGTVMRSLGENPTSMELEVNNNANIIQFTDLHFERPALHIEWGFGLYFLLAGLSSKVFQSSSKRVGAKKRPFRSVGRPRPGLSLLSNYTADLSRSSGKKLFLQEAL